MGIGSIGGFYSNYPIRPIKQVDVAEVKAQDEARKQQENQLPAEVASLVQPTEDTRTRAADLENISLGFNRGDTYDYIGKDSDLSLLDMDAVLSDMKKDSVLEQYRYFVGEPLDAQVKNGLEGDGVVILKS